MLLWTNKSKFFGHVLTSHGVQVEQEKVSVVQSWPIPANVKLVHGFLGLTLTKKEGFTWSKEALDAFNALKKALLSAPVLRLPDFAKTFVVECDASSEGIGGHSLARGTSQCLLQ